MPNVSMCLLYFSSMVLELSKSNSVLNQCFPTLVLEAHYSAHFSAFMSVTPTAVLGLVNIVLNYINRSVNEDLDEDLSVV